MFVRWKKQAPSYYAYLAESHRVNGQPRQKVLGYIGSIKERCHTASFEEPDRWGLYTWAGGKRHTFWCHAVQALAEIAPDMDEAQRQGIKEGLAAVVALPTPAEAAQLWQDIHKAQTSMWHGGEGWGARLLRTQSPWPATLFGADPAQSAVARPQEAAG
jgi:hypothetical protein